MKHIITVQHTQSEHHTNGMVGSWTDWNLTELGRQQADRIAVRLKEELAGKGKNLSGEGQQSTAEMAVQKQYCFASAKFFVIQVQSIYFCVRHITCPPFMFRSISIIAQRTCH